MDSASKSHLGISAAPVPLLIKGSAFERLADIRGVLDKIAKLTTKIKN